MYTFWYIEAMAKEPEQAIGKSHDNQDLLDIPVVSERDYLEVRKFVEGQGYSFILELTPDSVEDLLREDEARVARGEERIFEVDDVDLSGKIIRRAVDPSEEMRTKRPPRIEIAINLERVPIARSHKKNTGEHEEIIIEEKNELIIAVPGELEHLKQLIRVIMPTTAMVVQIDKAYKERFGIPLIDKAQKERMGMPPIEGEGLFIRANDLLSSEKGLARVGRYPTDKGMCVRGPDGKEGVNDVLAMAVVVLPKIAVS